MGDNESHHSDIIDYEQVQEDKSLKKAQWEAHQREEAARKGDNLVDVSSMALQSQADIQNIKIERDINSSENLPISVEAAAKEEEMKRLNEDIERKIKSLGFDEFKNENMDKDTKKKSLEKKKKKKKKKKS